MSRPWTASLRTLAYAAMAVLMASPPPQQLASRVPGDGGDALFLVWTMRWVNHAAPHGWTSLWNANIFAPAHHTLAFSDTLLPLAPLFGLLAWVTRSPALAFNILSIAAWTSSLLATDRLARRLGCGAGPAAVAATGFTFSTMRLAQYRHLQLAYGSLVPVCVLLLLCLLDESRLRTGIALGANTAVLTLVASYYGVLVLLTTGTVVLVHSFVRRDNRLRLAKALAAAGLVYIALIGPVAHQYMELQRNPHFRRQLDPTFNAHWSDFRAVSVDNRFVQHWWPVANVGLPKTGENWLFPGYVVACLALLGTVGVIGRRPWRSLPAQTRRELCLLCPAAIGLFVLALGTPLTIGSHRVRMPFAVLRHLMPGAAAMRVPARMSVLPMLLLAVFAGVTVQCLTRRLRPLLAAAICAALVGAVLLETSVRIESVPVEPTRAAAAVNHELAARARGVVLELPAASLLSGPQWAFIEAPRQLASTIDWQPRVNGYSGFQPEGFDQLVPRLNRFPDADVWPLLAKFDVRYVVLRTTIPVDIGVARRDLYERPGVGIVSDTDAQRMIADLPMDHVRSVEHVGTSYLIELRTSRPSPSSSIDGRPALDQQA